MEWNEKNLPLAKWLIDKTNTKDYRIGNLSGMKHPKVEGDLLKTVGGREELVRQAREEILGVHCLQKSDGENDIRIEVATTLERERGANKGKQAPIGIYSMVKIYQI